MTVSTYTRPNYSTQSGTAYPANIDAMAAAFERIAGAFAPHEQNVGSPAPDLTIVVDVGAVLDFSGSSPDLNEMAQQTVTGFTIPSSGQTRVDRVVIDETTGVARRIAGTPQTTGGSPTAVAPDIPPHSWSVCRVTITSADTAITNDMIVDERVGMPVKFVRGPASSTDNAIARFDGTTGKLIQNSGIRIDDSGRVLISGSSSVGNANANNLEITNPAGSGVCGMTFNVNLGSANTGNIYWRSTSSNNSVTISGDPFSSYLAFGTGGNERMRITSDGYIGVGGVTNPGSLLSTGASTTARASANIPHGTAPTSPTNGDVWTTTAGLFVRVNGVTQGPLTGEGAKAHGHVTVSGGTPTLNTSYNVSSLTDNGVGDFTFNFSTAFSSANYTVAGSAQPTGGGSAVVIMIREGVNPTTSACRIHVNAPAVNAGVDAPMFSCAFFGAQ